jgi:hypothetical protein
MRDSDTTRFRYRLAIFCLILGAVTLLPLLSRAQPSASINIVNNSNREIVHVYLSPVGSDAWSENKLSGDAVIAPGQSSTINSACDQGEIKVIGEDQNSCFLSAVVACGANATWTINNETPADCGQ